MAAENEGKQQRRKNKAKYVFLERKKWHKCLRKRKMAEILNTPQKMAAFGDVNKTKTN